MLGGNVISANGSYGVRLTDSSNNQIVDNLVGVGLNGFSNLGNMIDGVFVAGESEDNTIGGNGDSRNVISGNGLHGFELAGADVTGTRACKSFCVRRVWNEDC